jgi:hypothetical protein
LYCAILYRTDDAVLYCTVLYCTDLQPKTEIVVGEREHTGTLAAGTSSGAPVVYTVGWNSWYFTLPDTEPATPPGGIYTAERMPDAVKNRTQAVRRELREVGERGGGEEADPSPTLRME